MMIMPSNHSSSPIHYWAGAYPGKIGWLIGPSAISKTKLRDWLPIALDNDAFQSFTSKKEWDVEKWRTMLAWVRMHQRIPLWVLIPDVVANAKETKEKWEIYHPEVAHRKWPLAFAVQDGMTPDDVPENADVVFVGGTIEWKWKTVRMWCRDFKRVHVGRVSEMDKIWMCHDLGAESVDSTSWFRNSDSGLKMRQLDDYMRGIRPVSRIVSQLSLL